LGLGGQIEVLPGEAAATAGDEGEADAVGSNATSGVKDQWKNPKCAAGLHALRLRGIAISEALRSELGQDSKSSST
jgi:hypothetical protein